MANGTYDAWVDVILGAGTYAVPDVDDDTIKAVLCSASYTPDLTSDTYLDDIPSGAQLAIATVSGITIANRIVSVSSTITWTSVAGPTVGTQVVFYDDYGSSATSPLLVYMDTFDSGIPVTPDGTNIILSINASGLVQL